MTKKILKIVLIIALILGFCTAYVSASDINLDLPGADTNQTDDTQNTDNTSNNPDANVTSEDNQIVDGQDNNINNSIDNNTDNTNDTDNTVADSTNAETLQPSTVANSEESGLSVTNIINILLITVGVILILLAIAIIIRLK